MHVQCVSQAAYTGEVDRGHYCCFQCLLRMFYQSMCADSSSPCADAGTAHIVAILLVLARLAFILGGCRFRRYRLQSIPRIMQGTAIAAVALCLLVELFQLNARIAADPTPLLDGDIAPFEWAGGQPSTLSSITSCQNS